MREMFEGHLEGACGHQDHLRTRMRELEAEAQEATKQYQRATDLICSLQQQVTELKSSKASGLSAARSDQATLLSERATLSGENGTLCRDNGALNQAVKQLRADLANQLRCADAFSPLPASVFIICLSHLSAYTFLSRTFLSHMSCSSSVSFIHIYLAETR